MSVNMRASVGKRRLERVRNEEEEVNATDITPKSVNAARSFLASFSSVVRQP